MLTLNVVTVLPLGALWQLMPSAGFCGIFNRRSVLISNLLGVDIFTK